MKKKRFLSYPSAERELAERLTLALEAGGHEVFIDRSDLKAGEAFHRRLREAILSADAIGVPGHARRRAARQLWVGGIEHRPAALAPPKRPRVAGHRGADLAQARSARELCFTGGHAVALAQLNERAARLPPLPQGMARAASPERRADRRAHVGWGEYLRRRDGAAGLDPVAHRRRALGEDPANPCAHAMWARQLLDKPGRFDEARTHFAAAVASGRRNTQAFVRSLQLNTLASGPNESLPYAVAVADERRRAKETMRPDHRNRFWSHVFATRRLEPGSRAAVLSSLPLPDLRATFLWLFPDADVSPYRRPLWRFNLATPQAHKGDTAAARRVSGWANDLRRRPSLQFADRPPFPTCLVRNRLEASTRCR